MVVDFVPKGFHDKHWTITNVLVTRRSIELAKRVALEFGSIIIKQCKNSSYKQISANLQFYISNSLLSHQKIIVSYIFKYFNFMFLKKSTNKRNLHSLFHLLFSEIFCTMGYRNFCAPWYRKISVKRRWNNFNKVNSQIYLNWVFKKSLKYEFCT